MVQDREREGGTQWESIGAIAAKMGCSRETLRRWVWREQRDAGQRPGLTTDERERIRALEREVRELRQANEILRKASAYFAQAELDPLRWHSTCCAGRTLASFAPSSDDRLHRRPPRRLRGRANLQGVADCPVDLPRAQGQAG
jgi:transposase-like protein